MSMESKQLFFSWIFLFKPLCFMCSVFGENIRRDILQRVVRWQLAKLQSGNHKTKTRSEVSGSGKKAWKQKGTGRARVGNIRYVSVSSIKFLWKIF